MKITRSIFSQDGDKGLSNSISTVPPEINTVLCEQFNWFINDKHIYNHNGL